MYSNIRCVNFQTVLISLSPEVTIEISVLNVFCLVHFTNIYLCLVVLV